jgi:lipopolysaccharide export system protein LptA
MMRLRNIFVRVLFLPCFTVFLACLCCVADQNALYGASGGIDASAKAGENINVSAESMQYDPGAGKITFFRKVVVIHPNFTMFADKMDLLLSADKPADSENGSTFDSGKVETVISYTDVKILLSEGRVGTCDKAIYTVKTETVRMEGSAKKAATLTDSNNKLSGDVVLFYLPENKSEAHGHVQVEIISK